MNITVVGDLDSDPEVMKVEKIKIDSDTLMSLCRTKIDMHKFRNKLTDE